MFNVLLSKEKNAYVITYDDSVKEILTMKMTVLLLL